jgi:hypothetical protein
LDQIISEIKGAKYYGISIDSTPDVSHTDQLSVIMRYVLKDVQVLELLLMFVPIEEHDAEYLFAL